MNRQTLKLALLAVLLGLAVGMLAPRLLKGEWRDLLTEKEPVIILPEGELVSDAFSVKLLQTALQTPDYPVSFVCPAAMTEALRNLDAMGQVAVHEQLEALALAPANDRDVPCYFMAAIEESLPLTDEKRAMLLLPFRRNYPEALSTFNTLFGFPAADSANTSPDTRLFAAMRTVAECRFRQPFYAADSKTADFDNADGGMPCVRFLRRSGQFRVAEAEDGSWKAVALMLSGTSPDAAFIAVLPQGKAREFALQLTPAQMSTIRRALAEAVPQALTVEIPKLDIAVGIRNCAPLIQALGVTAPFDIRTADFSAVTTEKVAFNAVAESLLFVMPEEERRPADIPRPDNGAAIFSLNRPFLWFAGDLTSTNPPVVLGIVENL